MNPKPTEAPTWRLSSHIVELASAFNVALVMSPMIPKLSAMAQGEMGGLNRRAVFIANVTSYETYAIALHELGHAASPDGMVFATKDSDPLMLKLHEEQIAWQWAEHYALVWNGEMENVRYNGMESYHAAIRQRDAERVRKQQRVTWRTSQPNESLADFLKRTKK